MTVRGLIAGLAVGAGVSLAACGSDAPTPSGGPAPAPGGDIAASERLEHIHGLGVRDGALLIATHSGLWIAPRAAHGRSMGSPPRSSPMATTSTRPWPMGSSSAPRALLDGPGDALSVRSHLRRRY